MKLSRNKRWNFYKRKRQRGRETFGVVPRWWTATTTANSIWPDGKRTPYAARGCNSLLSSCNLPYIPWLRASRWILMDSRPVNPAARKPRLPPASITIGNIFGNNSLKINRSMKMSMFFWENYNSKSCMAWILFCGYSGKFWKMKFTLVFLRLFW